MRKRPSKARLNRMRLLLLVSSLLTLASAGMAQILPPGQLPPGPPAQPGQLGPAPKKLPPSTPEPTPPSCGRFSGTAYGR